MKKRIQYSLLTATILGAVLFSCKKNDTSFKNDEVKPSVQRDLIKDQYIVILNNNAAVSAMQSKTEATSIESQADYVKASLAMSEYAAGFMKQHSMDEKKIIKVYSNAINGFVATLTKEEVQALKKDGSVKSIEQNEYVKTPPTKFDMGGFFNNQGGQNFIFDANGVAYWTQNPQLISGGVTKARGFANGVGKRIYIIDTGVDPSHPDLNVDIARSANFITLDIFNPQTFTNPGLGDFCGHGTACAGFAAAKNNNGGVVGVAAGAKIIGVKVLFKDPNQGNVFNGGIGTTADVISGIDYVAAIARSGEVCNISIGGSFQPAFNDAVINLANKGVYVTISAGNSSINTANVSPASANHPKIFTVSAIDVNNNFASFSNFGADVDYTQVGVGGVSTLPFGRIIAGISGTSFSAPIVAGILAITKTPGTNGVAVNDPDGNADPVAALY